MRERVERVLDSYIESNEIPGASVLVVKDGEELLRLDRGIADRKTMRRFLPDTIVRLYSMTKPVTAAAAMILLERGVIDRLDPVSLYIPSFGKQHYYDDKGEKTPVSREMTIGDLLDMRGGLTYPDEETPAGREAAGLFKRIENNLCTENELTTMEVAEEIGKLTLSFDPGSSYKYSTSADVLGAVIEKASGVRFSEFLKNEIFEPLNMEDTAFHVPEEKAYRLSRTYVAESHIKEGVKGNEVPMSEDGNNEYLGNFLGIMNRMDKKPRFESGGAGLSSTLTDYMKFARMLLCHGKGENGKRVLSPETVRFMTERRSRQAIDDVFHHDFALKGFTYGNFLRICTEPGMGETIMVKGEYGWDGWTGPYFANIPSKNMTILIAMQRTESGTFGLTRRLINIIMSDDQFKL